MPPGSPNERHTVLRLLAALAGTALLFAPWMTGADAPGPATFSAWALGFLALSTGVAAAVNPRAWPDVVLLATSATVLAAPHALQFAGTPVALAHDLAGGALAALCAVALAPRLRRPRHA